MPKYYEISEAAAKRAKDMNRQYEMTPSLVKRGFTCHT